MTSIHPRAVSAPQIHPVRNSRSRLMMAASVSILTLFGPSAVGVYGGRARAQALPTGCEDAGGGTSAEAGETITCVAPPATIAPISTNVDDLTVVIGDGVTPTTIEAVGAGDAIVINGGGDQTLYINAGASVADGSLDSPYAPLVDITATDGDLRIDNAGTVDGYYGGVVGQHNGSGSISIDNGGAISSNSGIGLEVNAGASTDAISIVNSGSIGSNYQPGLQVSAGATDGLIQIENTGSITSSNATALQVAAGASDVAITSTGMLAGAGGFGLSVNGGDQVDISVGSASGGLSGAVNLNGANAIDFTSDGTITGGIQASNFGSAIFRLNEMTGSGSVINVGTGTTALTVQSQTPGSGSVGDIRLDVNNNSNAVIELDIHNAGFIEATNLGGGLSLTSSGTIENFICQYNTCDGGGVTLDLNDVTDATISGPGAIIIETTAAQVGDISVSVAGEMFGGVFIEHEGTGDSIVSVTDVEVLSLGGAFEYSNGVYVYHQGSSVGDIDITSTGFINVGNSESYAAVRAENHGTGGITINVNDVTGYNDDYGIDPVPMVNNDGVRAYTTSTAGDISVTTAGDVNATGVGVNVLSNGDSASTTVAVNNVTSSEEQAVYAGHSGSGDLSVTLNGTVDGGTQGVQTVNSGLGVTDITIAAGAAVTGQGAEGIRATSTNAASNITVQGSSGDVVGATNGIFLSTAGADITVQNLDSVTGQAGDGLYLNSNGGGVTVTGVDTILGTGGNGIFAESGGGDISIQGVGLVGGVTGTASDGIFADTGGGAGDVNIGGIMAIGAVTGAFNGIYANGYSNVTVVAQGDVNGRYGVFATARDAGGVSVSVVNADGADFDGINARTTSSMGTNLSVTSTGTVSGGRNGVSATHAGTGAIDINVNNVSGGTDQGILANNSANGADLNITATGAVIGGAYGITASNYGSGALTIDAVDVTGTANNGVYALNDGNGTDVVVNTTGTVSGGLAGVRVNNYGSGSTTITTADVSSDNGIGVRAYNSSTAADLIIDTSAGSVAGASSGVSADNSGSGLLSVTVADVTLTGGGNGVFATRGSSGGDIQVTATGAIDINGAANGVFAASSGGGDITIDVADVTIDGGNGVFASLSGATGTIDIDASGSITDTVGGNGVFASSATDVGDIIVNVADVTVANGNAIFASKSSGVEGDVLVTASGPLINQSSGAALFAANSAAGDIVANIGDASVGSGVGVFLSAGNAARNISLTSTGSIVGDEGVYAENEGSGDVSITVNNVAALAGGDDAIDAYNSANGGSLTIVTTGTITSADDDGIDAVNYGTDLSITVSGPVTGYQGGIEAYNFGSGSTSVTISGAVEGETEIGVFTVSQNGASVTVNAGGSVTGATNAIVTDGGMMPGEPADDTLTIMAGGAVVGDALLLAGDDIFNDAGGTFTTIFGGAGNDTVNFSGAGRAINGSGGSSDALQEFEIFNFTSGGFDIAGAHTGLTAANFLAGANTVSGSLGAMTTTIASGASLDAADGASFSGALVNNGALSLDGDAGGTVSAGSFQQGAGGVLTVNANGTVNDLLVVGGDVTLGGELAFASTPGLSFGSTTSTIIDGGSGLSGAFDTVPGGLLIDQSVELDPVNFDVLLTTTLNPASAIAGLNGNQSDVGDYLVGLLTDPALDPVLLDFIFAIGLNPDAEDVATILDNLTPEDIDQAMQFLSVSQRDFMRSLLNLGAGGADSGIASRNAGVRFASLSGGAAAPDTDEPFAWASFSGAKIDNGSSNPNHGFDGRYFQFRGGVGGIGAGPVKVGLAAAYSDYSGDSAGALGDDVDAETFSVAGTVGAPLAFGRIDGVAAYSGGEADIAMRLVDPVSTQTIRQTGEADITSYSLRARLSFNGIERASWSLTPHVQVGVLRTKLGDMTAGIGAAAINVLESKNTRGDVGLGASYYRQWNDAVSVHATVTGVRYFGDTQNGFASQFALAPAGGGSFATFGADVNWQAEIETGLAWDVGNGFNLGASVFSELGDLTVYGGRVGLSRNF